MFKNCKNLIRLKLIQTSRSINVQSSSSKINEHLSFDNQQIKSNEQSNENSTKESNEQSSNKKIHPFKNLYPWQNLEEFIDHIEKRVVFNDKDLIAIDKPWGVAYHKPNKTLHKPYSFETLSLIPGEPKFCLDNALAYLAERLEVEKLDYVKTIDRYSSGIILLSGNENAKPKIKKCINTNKSEGKVFYNFLCLAQGFPAIQGNELSEKVRIKLTDIDELADYKEPIIIPEKYNKKDLDKGYLTRVHMKINSINKFNSASYLQISTNQLRWNFVRCYVANKAAFIIGDLRFSANVKQILGQTVIETTNSFYKNNRIEPLNKEILQCLKVNSNRKVPVMLHLESIFLRNYKDQNLVISTDKLPDYFEFALKQLKFNKMNSKKEE